MIVFLLCHSQGIRNKSDIEERQVIIKEKWGPWVVFSPKPLKEKIVGRV
jgi:hypothetical protein|tara:strand:- start:549 stop:695 length:147 start_codon:yes stop_codon:yes gene_type:complete